MKTRRDPLDALFSTLIRERSNWTCDHCGKYFPEGQRQSLHCSHLWSRRKRSTRWHPLNSFSHCFSCHQKLGENPVQFHEWALERMGLETFEAVKSLANRTLKISKRDKEDIKAFYKKEIKRLQDLRARGITGLIQVNTPEILARVA